MVDILTEAEIVAELKRMERRGCLEAFCLTLAAFASVVLFAKVPGSRLVIGGIWIAFGMLMTWALCVAAGREGER